MGGSLKRRLCSESFPIWADMGLGMVQEWSKHGSFLSVSFPVLSLFNSLRRKSAEKNFRTGKKPQEPTPSPASASFKIRRLRLGGKSRGLSQAHVLPSE